MEVRVCSLEEAGEGLAFFVDAMVGDMKWLFALLSDWEGALLDVGFGELTSRMSLLLALEVISARVPIMEDRKTSKCDFGLFVLKQG